MEIMSRNNSLIVRLPILFQPSPAPIGATRANNDSSASSSSTPTPSKITAYFNKSQLALALSIQKSKPETLSTAEYCQQLLKHVRYGQLLPTAQSRYVDSSEFWKDQFEKVYLEKKILEKRIQSLEDAEDLRRAMHPDDDTQYEGDDIRRLLIDISKKDRGEDQLSRKRPTPPHLIEELSAKDFREDYFAADHSLKLSRYVLRVGKQRVILDKMVTETNTIDHIKSLTSQTFNVLGIIDLVLPECCLPLQLLRTNSGDTQTLLLFQQVMNQLASAFLSCFTAFDELCQTIPGRSQKSDLIHRMVLFFSKSLGLLHTISSLQAEHERVRIPSLRAKRIRTEEGEYAANKYLAAVLVSICHGIEWKFGQAGHSDILEGFIFSILEHTGRLVSETVFAEHVAASENPGNITKDIPLVNLGLAKFESRYVVQVLHAALGGTSRKDLIAQMLAAGKTNLRDSEGFSQIPGQMLSKSKLLLQSTLVKSAVGGNNLETLRMPTPPAELSLPPIKGIGEVERYGPEWLIETVWALIGWDLIT